MMILTDPALAEAEQAVLGTLRGSQDPYTSKDLIERLKARGYHDDVIRAAIWYLIDRMQIHLTADLRLVADPCE